MQGVAGFLSKLKSTSIFAQVSIISQWANPINQWANSTEELEVQGLVMPLLKGLYPTPSP